MGTLIGKVTGRKLEVDVQLGYSFAPLMVPGLGRISRENEWTGNVIAVIHSYTCVFNFAWVHEIWQIWQIRHESWNGGGEVSVASSEDLRRLSG